MDMYMIRRQHPGELGFSDHLIFDGKVYHCRTSPNPWRPSDGTPWWQAYGMVAAGSYQGQVEPHDRFGKCVLINSGKAIPSAYPNPYHNGGMIITEIFIHEANPGGKSNTWPGSAGCPTVPRSHWPALVKALPGIGHEMHVHILEVS